MAYFVDLPSGWIDATRLESAISGDGGPHKQQDVVFRFPVGCKIMIDSALRILSLCNQLDHCTRRVRLEFLEAEGGAWGYLNRMGFFDHLAPHVGVAPPRPAVSGASLHRGGNSGVVEIARINKSARDKALPGRLADALAASCRTRSDVDALSMAAWTIFAELIDNIFEHSETPLDGFAALQVYKGGNTILVEVSDSGLGIMKTLKPSLESLFPRLVGLSDVDLLVEAFRHGLSRHGRDRGCGLKGSAEHALRFQGTLDVRLPQQRVVLMPSASVYHPSRALCSENLSLVWGTHIGFSFRLSP